MLNCFVPEPQGLVRLDPPPAVIPEHCLWVDLVEPTLEEERAVLFVEAVRGLDLAHLLARRYLDAEEFLDLGLFFRRGLEQVDPHGLGRHRLAEAVLAPVQALRVEREDADQRRFSLAARSLSNSKNGSGPAAMLTSVMYLPCTTAIGV